jgi:hypothetical protein
MGGGGGRGIPLSWLQATHDHHRPDLQRRRQIIQPLDGDAVTPIPIGLHEQSGIQTGHEDAQCVLHAYSQEKKQRGKHN